MAQSAIWYVRPAPWEYVPEGWSAQTFKSGGWNDQSVIEMRKKRWREWIQTCQGTFPLGVNQLGCSKATLQVHNTLMAYAYVLALAARQRQRLSVLDWGGGMGEYYPLSRAILPEVEFDFHCQDLSAFCTAGRELLPDVHFMGEKDDCFGFTYDLVMASSSLWYEEDWKSRVRKLAAATNQYLYLTRMVFVEQSPSFIARQRPWDYGYRTEYLCWIFNRREFLEYVASQGVEIVREFLISEGPHIRRAPEHGDMRGFLFRKIRSVNATV